MESSDKISGVFAGQPFSGTIKNVSHECGSSKIYTGGQLLVIDPGKWTHMSVITDRPIKTPTGRELDSIVIRRSDVETGRVVLD